MNPWIVRALLALLALEAGICVAYLADDWEPLRYQEKSLFEAALTASREGGEFVVDEGDRPSRVRLVRPLEQGTAQPYFHISVDEESRTVLESFPPSPIDWHLLLKHMSSVGCQVAAVEQPLSWEGDDLYHLARLASLDRSLALFEIAILTVDLQRLPDSDPIPVYLKDSAIPIKQVRGELGSLVRVNRVMNAPSATAAPNVRFSFRIQESAEGVTPEFVRWDDYLIPSFPLAVAMAQHKVAPDQVTIELGRHIRLGDGPIIPIDEAGQLDLERMTLLEDPQPTELPAHLAVLESSIPRAQDQAGDSIPRCALFTDARPDNPAPWSDHLQLQKIVSSFDVLPHPSGTEAHHRLALGIELSLLVLIAMAAGFLIGSRGFIRTLAFLGLALLSLALLAALFFYSHTWTPVAPVLATAMAGWLLSIRMARYLPERNPIAQPAT